MSTNNNNKKKKKKKKKKKLIIFIANPFKEFEVTINELYNCNMSEWVSKKRREINQKYRPDRYKGDKNLSGLNALLDWVAEDFGNFVKKLKQRKDPRIRKKRLDEFPQTVEEYYENDEDTEKEKEDDDY